MLKALCSALVFVVAGFGAASAASPDPRADVTPPLVLAANGCGPGFFRTITGECEPNARVRVGPGGVVIAPPPCPRGYRRDPDPRRRLCYPIY